MRRAVELLGERSGIEDQPGGRRSSFVSTRNANAVKLIDFVDYIDFMEYMIIKGCGFCSICQFASDISDRYLEHISNSISSLKWNNHTQAKSHPFEEALLCDQKCSQPFYPFAKPLGF